jgi:hypothetical protein
MHGRLVFSFVSGIVLTCFLAGITGCGGGSSSTSTTPTQPTAPSGPSSGSEFLYLFTNNPDIQVANVNPSTGAVSSLSVAITNLYPTVDTAGLTIPIATPSGKFLYVLAFDQLHGHPAIFAFQITGANGQLSNLKGSFDVFDYPVPTGEDVNGMVMDAAGKNLYLSYSEYQNGDDVYGIQAMSINASTGELTESSPFSLNGQQAVQGTDPSGKYLYAWGIGNDLDIFVYSIDPTTGALSSVTASPFTIAPNVDYSTFVNAQLLVSPSGQSVYLYLVGGSTTASPAALYALSVDPKSGSLSPVSGSPFNVGNTLDYPLALEPNGNFLYVPTLVANMSGCDINVFAVNATTGTVGTNPTSTVADSGFGCELTMDPSGQTLVARGGDDGSTELWPFIVDQKAGSLQAAKGAPFTLLSNAYVFGGALLVRIR